MKSTKHIVGVEIRTASRKETVWVSADIAKKLRLIVAEGSIKSVMQIPHSAGLAIINWKLTEGINVGPEPYVETEEDLLFTDEDVWAKTPRRRHPVSANGP